MASLESDATNDMTEKNIKSLDYCFEKVVEFQEVFRNPIADRPEPFSEGRRELRAKYLREELDELIRATTLEDQCDALIDIIYFALGGFAEIGVRPHAIFEIVHMANMRKLFPDGVPRHRLADGKVEKPPGWMDPRDLIVQEIAQQARKAAPTWAGNVEFPREARDDRRGFGSSSDERQVG